MWNQRENNVSRSSNVGGGGGGGRGGGGERCIAVAIDKDKASQNALKWAVDNIVTRDENLKLVHVKERPPFPQPTQVRKDYPLIEQQIDNYTKELFLAFRCFCRRRQVQCETIVLEDQDVAKALIEYVCQNGVETLILGSATKNGLSRLFKTTDVPTNVLKWAPDFCTVYVISKGKISTVRNATRILPALPAAGVESTPPAIGGASEIWYDELSAVDIDNPVPCSGRPSTDSNFFYFYENLGSDLNKDQSPRRSSYSSAFRNQAIDNNNLDNARISWSSSVNNMEEYEDEMRRLKTELKQTIDMYLAACKEALAAKRKATELEEWKRKEEKRLKEAHVAEKNALAMVEREKAKCNVAIEAAEAVQKLVEVEVQKRMEAEMKALKETEEKQKVLNALGQSHIVLKYQSLLHMLVVFFLFYFYFSLFK